MIASCQDVRLETCDRSTLPYLPVPRYVMGGYSIQSYGRFWKIVKPGER